MSTDAVDSVGHRPAGKWTFDETVTGCFADMLERSIPDYHTMRKLVLDVGSWFVQNKTHIVDLGASRGDGLLPFIERFGAGNRFFAFDESESMVEAAKKNLSSWAIGDLVTVRHFDLRNGLPPLAPSLVLSVLTLQFVPIEHRQRIISDAYRILRPGGAMIVVEKTLGNDAACDKLLVDQYYALKRENGYSADDIEAKRKSLEGSLVPMTAAANVAMLEAEGFKVQQFWQALQFVGWVAIKSKASV